MAGRWYRPDGANASSPSSLNDPGALPGEIHSISWPFSYVMPGTFHSLSADQKQMIEDMILAMAKRNQGSR